MSNHVNTDLISITFYNKDTVDVLLKDCEEEVRALLKAIVENTEVRENTGFVDEDDYDCRVCGRNDGASHHQMGRRVRRNQRQLLRCHQRKQDLARSETRCVPRKWYGEKVRP